MTRKDDGGPRPKPGRRRTRSSGKKERVLHTRVPAVLEQELKRLAGNLRVPVSNVVRAILEDALDAVETVSERTEEELLTVAERLARQRRRRTSSSEESTEEAPEAAEPEAPPGADEPAPASERATPDETPSCPSGPGDVLDGVFGYQPLVLAASTECTICGRLLASGSEAHRALFDEPGRRVFLGPECRLLPAKES